VPYQTHEICLAAVKQDGLAIRYVKDQTRELCLAAVTQDGEALEFIKNQTEEICLAAVRQSQDAINFITIYNLKKLVSDILKYEKNYPRGNVGSDTKIVW
jgi:hypothetical protein